MRSRLSPFLCALSLFLACGCKGKSPQEKAIANLKSIAGTVMLDVTCYGYRDLITLNGVQVHSGKNASFSGIVSDGAAPGRNRLRIEYGPEINPNLSELEVALRLVSDGQEKPLLRWKAPDPSGAAELEFELPSK